MLTVEQKATILERTGSDVPPFPRPASMPTDALLGYGSQTSFKAQNVDIQHADAVARWNRDIEVLFSYYSAARAAKGLREAELTEQMAMLRLAMAHLP